MNEKNAGRKLKIAIVLDKFLPSTGGQSYFSFLVRELVERGHEVHVFATTVEEIPGVKYHLHLIPILRYPKTLRLISFVINSSRVINRYRFDVIHEVMESLTMNVFNPHGGVEKAYLKQEFASIRNRLYYAVRFVRRYLSPFHYITVWIQKKQYLSKDLKAIIAISSMIKRNIIDYYHLPEEKIHIVFNSVDLKKFHPDNRLAFRAGTRKELGIADTEMVLMFAGHNYRLKGLDTLLGSLSILKRSFGAVSLRLLVIGSGNIGRYQRRAKKLGVEENVMFLGSIRNIERYYAASDIYVHPTFYDSCSLTVLEALASGLATITTQYNGAADAILSDEGGRVVKDPADARELADAISYYFDEDRRKKASPVARRWMEKYSPEYNIEETLKVYYQVAGENGSGR